MEGNKAVDYDSFQPEVSVVCITYNHAPYIKDCLESILAQRTSFGFEIIVHDDASTDGTDSIIRDYAAKFPGIIKPILQPENLHSKKQPIAPIIANALKGRYVALCEGDDYWISANKLQTQYKYMMEHESCSLCVHAAYCVSAETMNINGIIAPSRNEKDYSTDEIIRALGGLFATNSMFFKSKYYLKPALYNGWGVGDLPHMIHLSTCGEVHYLPEIMSAYRRMVPNSWSSRMKSDPAEESRSLQARIDKMNQFDKATDYVYHSSIEAANQWRESRIFSLQNNWGSLKNSLGFRNSSVMGKMRFFLDCSTPNLSRLLRKIQNSFIQLKWHRKCLPLSIDESTPQPISGVAL